MNRISVVDQFAQSSDPGDLTKAVSYGELAARRAMSVYAYGEAVHHLERASLAQDVLDRDDRAKRCDLLLALGAALGPDGQVKRIIQSIAPDVVALAESIDDRQRASAACALALDGLHRDGGAIVYLTDAYGEWVDRADRFAVEGTRARVLADGARAQRMYLAGQWGEAKSLVERAVEQARLLDDREALFWASSLYLMPLWPPEQTRERVKLATDIVRLPRDGVTSRTLSSVLLPSQIVFLVDGNRDVAEAVWRDLDLLASRTRDATVVMWSGLMQAFRASLDGELERSLQITDQVRDQAEEIGLGGSSRQANGVGFRPCIWMGRFDEALSRARYAQTLVTRTTRQVVALAHMGRVDEARTEFERGLAERSELDLPETPAASLCFYLELAVILGHHSTAEILLTRLQGTTASHPTVRYELANIARYLGALSVLVGDRSGARAHYERGLAWATKIRYRPEIALTRLEMAELLLRGTAQEPVEAQDHLDFAIEEFRAMKMQPSLERALRHKGLLHA